jgi:hypothetical protein
MANEGNSRDMDDIDRPVEDDVVGLGEDDDFDDEDDMEDDEEEDEDEA